MQQIGQRSFYFQKKEKAGVREVEGRLEEGGVEGGGVMVTGGKLKTVCDRVDLVYNLKRPS